MCILIVMMSLLTCAIGIAREMAEANVRHVQNGRTPNAGAALFPTIPFIQFFYLFAAWSLNQIHQDLGFFVVAAYSVLNICIQVMQLRRASATLRMLKNENAVGRVI